MIQFKNIHLGFNLGTPMENKVLRGIDLSIPEGEFITVIGSNGAGKSTLLKCLTGAARCQKGSITLDDADITRWSSAARARYVAHVFQDPMIGTCADLSIEENMALAYGRGQPFSWSLRNGFQQALTKDKRDEFQDYVKRLGMGLEHRLSDPIGLLSGGQRQTLSLLMAVLSPMKILVLDEHTAALDPKMSDKVMELTRQIIAERQLTTLMVTHSMSQALSFGTRTIMMHQGKVVLDLSGSERENLNTESLLALFKQKSGQAIDDDRLILGS